MSGRINVDFTIFGGTGDLAFRKLIPALYHLFLRYRLDSNTRIIIVGRRAYTPKSYCEEARPWVEKISRFAFNEELYQEFCNHLIYYQMDLKKKEEFEGLCDFLNQEKVQSQIFYYAVSPELFDEISEGLSQLKEKDKVKIIVEKPFGSTLQQAYQLDQLLRSTFNSDNIYRIDHYLGKEMIQSIQAIRFANPLFKDSWNHRYIEKVEIIASEELGVETRGSYYDQTGALKDMVQNHLFQIMTIVAMEKATTDQEVYDEQLKVLRSLRKFQKEDISKVMILGQYEGYQQEHSVNSASVTETFASLRLYIDNERWKDVPFIVQTGKKLSKRKMEVVLTFRKENIGVEANQLRIKIQPDEGVKFKFNIKRPGNGEEIISTEMEFCQTCNQRYRLNTPEAYERLLDACIQSKRSLFSRWEQIEMSWKYVDELKKLYYEKELPIISYPQGSDGPEGI